MSVRFIIGRAGSGKTRRIFRQVVDALRDDPLGPPIYWILPKQATFQTERRLACAPELGGFCRARILSFDQLGNEILNDCGGIAVPRVTALGRQMLIGRLLRNLQPQLQFFASSAHRPGLAAELDATFSEVERSGKDVAELASMLSDLEQAEADNAARAPLLAKIRDLRLLYTEYSRFLGQERLDPHRRIAQVVESVQRCSMFRRASVYVDGFDDFTEYERQLLAGLARATQHAEIALTLDPASPLLSNPHLRSAEMSLFHRTEETYQKLYFTFTAQEIEPDEPVLLREVRRFSNPALAALEHDLFGTAGAAKAPPDDIRLIECPDRRAEVDAAARRVREHLRQGLRLRDIAVLMRDLNDYHELIDASFREHAIPYFVDRRRTAAHHPLLQFTRAAFALAQQSWPHDAVVSILKSGLAGLTLDEADELENYVLLHRIRGAAAWTDASPWTYRRDLTRAGEDDELPPAERFELQRVNALRDRVVKRLRPFVQALRAETELPIRRIVRELFALYESFDIRATIVRWMDQATEALKFEQAGEHEQVWAEMVGLFEQMVELLGDERVSLADFLDILESGFEGFDLALTPPTIDQVLVGQVDRTRTPDLQAVILLGMNDAQFPKVGREDSILSDAERRLLRDRRIDITPDTQRQLLDERFLAYQAFTRSSRHLSVTRALADDESRPSTPSPYWRRLVQMMPRVPIDHVPRSVRSDPSRLGTPRQLVTSLMRWVRDDPTPDATTHPAWAALYQWLATHECCDDYVDIMRYRAWRALRYENAARLGAEFGQKLFKSPLHSSVSRIETFATCPFKHFARYGLKLSARDDQDVTALDLGNVYHQILEKIVRAMLEKRADWSDVAQGPEGERMVRAFADEVSKSLRGELMLSTARNRYLLQRIEKTLHQVIASQRAMRARGAFRPKYAELGFGRDDAGLPAFSIPTPAGNEILLHGKIDRVDMLDDQSSFAVIDYKLTGNTLSLDRVYHGISLQLLTYLLVLQANAERLDARKLTPAAAFYVRLLRKLDDVKHPDDATPPDDPKFHLKEKPRGICGEKHLSAFDSELTTGPSDVLQAFIKQDGSIGRPKASDLAHEDDFAALLRQVHRRLAELGDQLLSGDIRIAPFRMNRSTPCPNCEYRAICRFDSSINNYNHLRPMNREEVFERLRAEGGKDGR